MAINTYRPCVLVVKTNWTCKTDYFYGLFLGKIKAKDDLISK